MHRKKIYKRVFVVTSTSYKKRFNGTSYEKELSIISRYVKRSAIYIKYRHNAILIMFVYQ